MSSKTVWVEKSTKDRVDSLKRRFSTLLDEDLNYDKFMSKTLDVLEAYLDRKEREKAESSPTQPEEEGVKV